MIICMFIFLQHKVYCDTDDVPVELHEYIDEETFEKSRSYQIDKSNFSFYSGLFSQIESTVRKYVLFHFSLFYSEYIFTLTVNIRT